MARFSLNGFNIKDRIFDSVPAKKIKAWAQQTILPGFQGVSLYEAGSFFIQNMNNVNLSDRCAAVTYNFLTALPPTLLFLFTLIPYLPLQNVQITILTTLKLMIPNDATYKGISSVINDFLNKEQRSILSLSLLLSLFYSSNGVIGLMRYFDKDHKVYVVRSAVQRRWAAIKLTIMLIGVVLASIAVFIIQTETLNNWLQQLFGSAFLIRMSSMLLLSFIIYSAISCIYIYGPSLTHRFSFISAGAVFATFTCIASSAIFFYAVNNFINYNKVYGSIGTLIAAFVWLSMNTRFIMLGYDLNVSILMGRIHKTQKMPDIPSP